MKRRAFLIVADGLVLPPHGKKPLPPETVTAIGKKCSFCDKPMSKAKSMSGFAGCPLRVCDECVARSVEVVGEADLPTHDAKALLAALDGPPRDRPKLRSSDATCSFCEEKTDATLVAGPVDYICATCVAAAAALLHAG